MISTIVSTRPQDSSGAGALALLALVTACGSLPRTSTTGTSTTQPQEREQVWVVQAHSLLACEGEDCKFFLSERTLDLVWDLDGRHCLVSRAEDRWEPVDGLCLSRPRALDLLDEMGGQPLALLQGPGWTGMLSCQLPAGQSQSASMPVMWTVAGAARASGEAPVLAPCSPRRSTLSVAPLAGQFALGRMTDGAEIGPSGLLLNRRTRKHRDVESGDGARVFAHGRAPPHRPGVPDLAGPSARWVLAQTPGGHLGVVCHDIPDDELERSRIQGDACPFGYGPRAWIWTPTSGTPQIHMVPDPIDANYQVAIARGDSLPELRPIARPPG